MTTSLARHLAPDAAGDLESSMTPDQSPGLGTNPNHNFTLEKRRLKSVPPEIWNIETQEIEVRDDSGRSENFFTEFVASTPVSKREAAHTLSPDVRKLPPEYQRATRDL